jgi:magnesium-transporting ATPase (P-type)
LTFQIVPLHNSFFGGKFSIWNLKSDYDLRCIYIDTISFISSNYLFFLSVFVINILLLSPSFPYLHFLFVQESTVVKKKKQEEVNKEKEVYRWLQNKLQISQTIIIICSIFILFYVIYIIFNSRKNTEIKTKHNIHGQESY